MANSYSMPNFSQDQINTLLNLASKKLGVKPEALKEQLQNGKLPQGITQDNVSQLLNDPRMLEALLSSKSAQQMLQNLMRGGK